MKPHQLFAILTFTFFVSCNSNNSRSINSEALVELSKDSIAAHEWLNKVYNSIKEPNLSSLEYECYRFNYLDAFGNNKLFRIEYHNDHDIRLTVKLYDKNENYKAEIFTVKYEQVIDLDLEQFNEFKKLVEGSYFWRLQMVENPQPMYLDGFSYLLEGFEPRRSSNKKYHIVARSVPHDGSFKEACEKLMDFHDQHVKYEKSND